MVAGGHPVGEDLGAVRRHPAKILAEGFRLVAEAAPEEGGVDVEPAQDLGELGDVAEGVRDVALVQASAEVASHGAANQEVADQRFGTDQELVGQHVPGPDLEPPGPDMGDDCVTAIGADLQVVLQDDRLAVQHEAAEVGVGLEQPEHLVDQLDQRDPELLERDVPGPIPVGVRDHDGELGISRVHEVPHFLRRGAHRLRHHRGGCTNCCGL